MVVGYGPNHNHSNCQRLSHQCSTSTRRPRLCTAFFLLHMLQDAQLRHVTASYSFPPLMGCRTLLHSPTARNKEDRRLPGARTRPFTLITTHPCVHLSLHWHFSLHCYFSLQRIWCDLAISCSHFARALRNFLNFNLCETCTEICLAKNVGFYYALNCQWRDLWKNSRPCRGRKRISLIENDSTRDKGNGKSWERWNGHGWPQMIKALEYWAVGMNKKNQKKTRPSFVFLRLLLAFLCFGVFVFVCSSIALSCL